MSLTSKERKILEDNGFRVHKYQDGYVELEQWTDGGVDMIISYDSKKQTAYEGLGDYLFSFDIDEEIDLYRQDEKYKNDFSITQSVRDFTDWQELVEKTRTELAKKAYSK